LSKFPLVSIIVETGTRKLAERTSFDRMANHYLSEARRALPDPRFEFIFVGQGQSPMELGKNCRFLDRPGLGYYGFKNEGAKAARGRYLVYWDSDCRVKPGYLGLALKAFQDNPDVIGLGGLTLYDGNGYFGRVYTALNFGPHFKNPPRYTRLSVTVNNICLIRSAFPSHPFGPFTGRTGGDSHITQYAVKKGKPFLQHRGLISYHEDQTGHWRTLVERSLRDLFQPVLKARPSSKRGAWTLAFLNWPLLSLKRVRRILVYGRAVGLNWREMACSPLFLAYLALLEGVSLLCMAIWPPLIRKWLHFQFGSSWVKARGIR